MKRVNRVFNGVAPTIVCMALVWFGASAVCRYLAWLDENERKTAAAEAQLAADQEADAKRRARVFRMHVPAIIEGLEGLPTSGPTRVRTGIDGGEHPSGAWTKPSSAASSSSSCVAVATAGVAASLKTNTLKCQFNAASFSLPIGSTVTGLTVGFRAWSSNGMGSPIVNVASVKTSITISDASDGATLTSSDQQFSYNMLEIPSAVSVEDAWEIDLVFSSATNSDFGAVNLYDVTATVSYSADDTDTAQINERMMTWSNISGPHG